MQPQLSRAPDDGLRVFHTAHVVKHGADMGDGSVRAFTRLWTDVNFVIS
jgi:hypothetical protein